MKSQVITALSVIAVLGAAGGAFAANSTVLSSASTEPSVIGTATPVLVPVAPKGVDIPEDYRQRLADATGAPLSGQGGASGAAPTQSTAPAAASTYSDDDDDDDHEDESHDDESDDDD